MRINFVIMGHQNLLYFCKKWQTHCTLDYNLLKRLASCPEPFPGENTRVEEGGCAAVARPGEEAAVLLQEGEEARPLMQAVHGRVLCDPVCSKPEQITRYSGE
jgi:hypothetical protein